MIKSADVPFWFGQKSSEVASPPLLWLWADWNRQQTGSHTALLHRSNE